MAVNQKYLMPLLFFMDNQHLLQSGVGENVCKCDDCTHENVSILAPDENDQRIALSKKGVEIFDWVPGDKSLLGRNEWLTGGRAPKYESP